MRLPLVIAGLAVACFAGVGLWVYLSQPTPFRDTIRHVASTKPLESAVEMTPLAAVAIALPTDLGQRPGADWPAFLGPTGDAKSPEKGIKSWPAAGPKVVWTVELGEGYAGPVVSRGRALVFDRVNSQARCRCLHSESGRELWRFSYATEYVDRQGWEGGPRATPVTDGYRVYLHGSEGMLHCLRLADGKLLWRIDTSATFGIVQNLFGAASAPLIDGDRVLLQIGGSPAGSTDRNFMGLENNGSCIVAFDKTTGKILYQCGNGLASYASPQVATLNGKRTGLVFARAGLLAFDPERGVELFRYPFRSRSYNSVNASNCVIADGQIFLTESYELGCTLLSVKDNHITSVWLAPPRDKDVGLACHWNTPILVDGHLYGCASRHQGDAELRCIEWTSGRVKWIARPMLKDEPAGRCSLTFADNHFFCLSEEGILFLIKADPQQYEQVSVWDGRADATSEHSLKQPCWAAPVLAHGLLYVRGKSRLVCLEVR